MPPLMSADDLRVGDWRFPYDPTGNARQMALHSCPAQEILYGGAAGGGKSAALIAAGVYTCLAIPNCKVILFRRTYKMLEEELIPRMLRDLPEHIAHYNKSEHSFTFRNGAVFRLGYMDKPRDVENYTGAEYVLVLWDELTQFPRKPYVFMRSRLRMAGEVADAMRARGWVPRMIATSNPGGIGHGWCKRQFIDPWPGRDEYWWGGIEKGDPPEGLRSVAYIPARAGDNPFLDLRSYMAQLAGLDPILRRALIDGDWDILEGTRFSQFRRAIHVIDPGQLPISPIGYPRAVGVDYGLSAPFAAVWGALLPDNLVVIYREIGGPNITAENQAKLILEAESPGERGPYRPIPIALDPSCWTRGPASVIKPLDPDTPPPGSIAWFYRRVLGGHVHKAWNDRVGGAQLYDHGMLVRPDGLPRLLIYSTCTNMIRTLPELQRSLSNPEDVATVPKQDDHWYDAGRYLLGDLVRGGIQRVPPDVPEAGADEDAAETSDARYDALLSGHKTKMPVKERPAGWTPWSPRHGETDF